MDKYVSSLQPKLLYVMEIPDTKHRGCVKVGDATISDGDPIGMAPSCKALNQAAHHRIQQYTKTAEIDYRLLYTELLIFFKDGKVQGLRDYQVHDVLKRSGIKQPDFAKQGREWYCCDAQTVANAIKAAKEGRSALDPGEITVPELAPAGEVRPPSDEAVIKFREEQLEAISKTVKHFSAGGRKMLWNAKMRFGKTLSTLEVVRQLDYHRTLIITHRPVVDDEWFGEFKKIFTPPTNFRYGSRKNGEKFVVLERDAKAHANKHYIYFASVQDLRGSDLVGGNFEKNLALFDTPWDMLIIDEAHEGTQTVLGQNVIEALKKDNTHVLSLSGTPFNLLDDYEEKELFTWDYVMEQKAKEKWDIDHFGDPNPYSELPKMNIYTFELGRLLTQYEDISDKAFNFKEFFRVQDGEFVHKQDVRNFLNLIVKYDSTTNYPYSTAEFRRYFRHSLWMIPGVKEAKALSEMLQTHEIFGKFQIVNVAGDGDDDVPSDQATKMVKDAIGPDPEDTYTITLSCGRLTTGVTIKPWTAVFMLSGSYSTDAKAYMQTIFRVQSPWNYKGKQKEECYVFDFAPDRTLKVIAQTAKVSTKAGKTTGDERAQMKEFLNFCPVIGYNGTHMEPYDEKKMLEQLKRVYIDRVVRRGFDDVYIYSDELRKVTGEDLLKFEKLKKIIGTTKAMHKTDSVDMAKNGLTDEEYAEKEKLEKKPKRQRTPEEQARLEELKKEHDQKNALISILRGISIRIPLLIYGADLKDGQEITMQTLPDLVDDLSWEEFMPKDVTKDLYREFVKFYDEDVIRSAARQIRDTARAADALSPTERVQRIALIFSHFHNPDKETVLTPWRVVNMHMADCIGGYKFLDEDNETELNEPVFIDKGEVTKSIFADLDTRILEINSKTGLYPLYMTYSTYRFARQRFIEKHMLSRDLKPEEEQAIWDEVVSKNIFVICKTKMARSITRRTLLGFRKGKANLHAFDDLINQVQNNKESLIKNITRPGFWNIKSNTAMLKFNVVVGNPPYQLVNKGDGTGADPIYNYFIDLAKRVSYQGTLIHPGRFLFNAGKTPKDWNNRILNDPHFKVIKYWSSSFDVFPSVDIKGGIAITYWNNKEEYKPIGFFTIYPELKAIVEKVKAADFEPLSQIVYPRDLYHLTEKLYLENSWAEGRQSEGHKFDVGSGVFDVLPELFFDKCPNDGKKYSLIYGRVNNERVLKWIRSDYLKSPDNLDSYKVFVAKTNGSGTLGEPLSTPIVGEPNIGHTVTFLSIGKFDSEGEAKALLKYIQTKFARTLLGTLKVTQDNPKETWSNIPIVDFTSNSDIDWSKSVAEIDQQLYRKYKLSQPEIDFIESMIKPMA